MLILHYLLSSVNADINLMKTLDETPPVRVLDATFCANPDYLPLRFVDPE